MGTLLEIGLTNAAMATALALFVVGIAWWVRRPALVHALWLMVLLKLVLPVGFGVGAWSGSKSQTTEPQVAPSQVALTLAASERVEIEQPKVIKPAVVPPPAETVPPIPVLEAAKPESAWEWPRWQTLIGVVWLGGSLGWCGLVGLRLIRFRRLLRYAYRATDGDQDMALAIGHQFGLKWVPAVWLVPTAVSPMLWALGWRPRLLLPAELWERFDAGQRATLLAHELAHLRRGDHWVRRLELIVLGIYWWHPVAWWARRELQEAEEACCDASWVVWAMPAAAEVYPDVLVETISFLANTRPVLPPAASGIGRVQRLKRRLTMIANGSTARTLSRAGVRIHALRLGLSFFRRIG